MEKGTINSYDQDSGGGTIGRLDGADVRFTSDKVLGRDRIGLKQGDSVWFEVENILSNHVAVNIRKCM